MLLREMDRPIGHEGYYRGHRRLETFEKLRAHHTLHTYPCAVIYHEILTVTNFLDMKRSLILETSKVAGQMS